MFKRTRIAMATAVTLLCLSGFLVYSVNAVMTASGDDAPISTGKNVLCGMAINDSPGSSDLTLIIQLLADGDILVDEGSECTVIQPLENIPNDGNPTGWTMPDFDDSDWQVGEYGIGYGDGDDNTVIGDGQHAAVYSRAIFEIKNASSIQKLRLGVDFDDAAVIWINGVEIARESGTDVPEFPEWDSWSDEGSGHSHEASKTDPPNYSFVDVDFKVVGSIFAVDPAGKLASTWAGIKYSR